MAADLKQKYGTSAQAITITLASLASTSLRECTAIDNGTNLFNDVKVQVKIKTNAAGTVATGVVNVYAYGTTDGGTTYSGGATGTDAAYTAASANLIYLGQIAAAANATTYNAVFNLQFAFGYGGIPVKWGVVVENLTGAALDATGGSHVVQYQGVLAQSV